MGNNYETIAISPITKKKFKQLKNYKQTDEDFLKELLRMYNKEDKEEVKQ